SRRVALKVLRLDSSSDPQSAADASNRVLREARAAASLDHPNAVSIFDVGETDGRLYIAMELVVGKTLRAFVGDPAVRWEAKLHWLTDAARALGAAHDRGLVHRDVKPENIMVRSDGVVKVVDFGIAKKLRVDVGAPGTFDGTKSQSFQGGIVGTPWYLSPEQLRGDAAVDGRADQFSWAVTAYEVLTGVLPWPKGVDGFQLVLAILNKMPEAPSSLLPALPSIVDATIMKALAKAASQRFEAMEFVVTALETIITASRRSWAEFQVGAMTKTDPAPPLDSAPMMPAIPVTHEPTTLPSNKPSRRPPRRRSYAALAAALGLVAAAALIWGHPAPTAPSATPSAAASAAAADEAGGAITSAPLPRSPSPEALVAYQSFRRSFRDADWNAAMRNLSTAVERDPNLGAAHLRLAFMRSLESVDEGLVRTTFLQANRSVATMDERDAALLDALAPYLQDDPSDPLESAHRLEALRVRWPRDAEIAYVLGSVRYDRGDLAAALDAFDAAIALDADFALAWSSKGGCLAYLGRLDDGRTALEEALHRSRTATEPLWYESAMDEQQGACATEEAHVRTWLSRDPDDWYAYRYLARALASEGRAPEAVLAALEQEWARLEPDHRAKIEPGDRARLAAASGDFASAEQRLREVEKALSAEAGAQAHAESHALLARIAEETGHPEKARAVADAFLARKDAWAPSHRVDNVSIFLDPIPEMLGVLVRVGAITAAQRDERRASWLEAWRAKTSAAYQGDLWITAWAASASSRADGEAALAALPAFGGVAPFTPDVPADAFVGHAYLLARRTDEAVARLHRGAKACTLLADPFGTIHGFADLGAAEEARGAKAEACDAYRSVLDRWGHARPRSITAERARDRMTALGCR
ncbi:MAG TPA: protein kinase, partial [Polyangiaceae bacterium]